MESECSSKASRRRFKTFKEVQGRLRADYDLHHNWIEVGRLHDISAGMAWKIVNEGYIPKTARIRAKLGLPHQIVIDAVRDEKGRFVEHQ